MANPSADLDAMDFESSARPVCVTGATGFIASCIVRDLLSRGYTVRATVHPRSSQAQLAALRQLPSAGHSLYFVEVDMLAPRNLREVLSGCGALIHAASPECLLLGDAPAFKNREDVHERQVRPVVDSTRALLAAAIAEGVKKVVLLSSQKTMCWRANADTVLNEDSFSDIDYVTAQQLSWGGACALAKTLQEQLAWEMAAKYGFKLVTVHPGVVVGPSVTGYMSAGMEVLMRLAKGQGLPYQSCRAGTVPDGFLGIVDVRDVAAVHVLALEKGEANGRYLLLTKYVHYADIVQVMRQASARFARLPNVDIDSPCGQRYARQLRRFDNSKMRALGVDAIRWQDTVAEAARVLESKL